MDNIRPNNSPPIATHGIRLRPRPLLQSSSPLNPNHADGYDTKPPSASAHPISALANRRMSTSALPYSYARRGSTPATPRFSPRSPLSFLEPSPSSSMLSYGSSMSSDGWPRTPQSPLSHLSITLPSPTNHLPASLSDSMIPKPSSSPVTLSRSSLSSSSSVSVPTEYPSSPLDHRPAFLKCRPDLDEIPPSPPIVNPACLLGRPAIAHASGDYSIASPFLNLDSTLTYISKPEQTASPLAKRFAVTRRPSALAHELGQIDLDPSADGRISH